MHMSNFVQYTNIIQHNGKTEALTIVRVTQKGCLMYKPSLYLITNECLNL